MERENRHSKESFLLEMREFLEGYSIEYSFNGDLFFLERFSLLLLPVAMSMVESEREALRLSVERESHLDYIFIPEDLWITKGELYRNRVLSRIGKGRVLYARECRVKEIDGSVARSFLEKNHLLGYGKTRYKYGLYYGEVLVAVATFSHPRNIERGGVERSSYEWVGYASLGSLRVVGGMSKLLSHFMRERLSERESESEESREVESYEVMSYFDKEWGRGGSYRKMGFKSCGESAPLLFKIEPTTFKRSVVKGDGLIKTEEGELLLYNLGNEKFVKSFF